MGRTLREYEHMAQKQHVCSICQRRIQPGDLYRGIVSASRERGISVWKEHYNPMCPDEFFTEEEELMRRALEYGKKERDKGIRNAA